MPTCKTCVRVFEGPYRQKYCSAMCQMLYRVQRAEIDECWEWTGAVGGHGYGVANVDGKPTTTHRLSYSLLVGEIPEGILVCHRCDNRKCINPNHLFIGTYADNAADMAEKGRSAWRNKKMPAEMREKLSLAKRGVRGKHTEVQKNAVAKVMRENWAKPEFREMMRLRATNKVCTEATREKLRNRKISAETRERMRIASIAREERKRKKIAA